MSASEPMNSSGADRRQRVAARDRARAPSPRSRPRTRHRRDQLGVPAPPDPAHEPDRERRRRRRRPGSRATTSPVGVQVQPDRVGEVRRAGTTPDPNDEPVLAGASGTRRRPATARARPRTRPACRACTGSSASATAIEGEQRRRLADVLDRLRADAPPRSSCRPRTRRRPRAGPRPRSSRPDPFAHRVTIGDVPGSRPAARRARRHRRCVARARRRRAAARVRDGLDRAVPR